MVNASLTFAEFEKLYRDAFKGLATYSPKQAGFMVYVEKMAELSDAFPECAEIVENDATK
jgi:hypothetical protein